MLVMQLLTLLLLMLMMPVLLLLLLVMLLFYFERFCTLSSVRTEKNKRAKNTHPK
jgi:uncharacterized membrane protein